MPEQIIDSTRKLNGRGLPGANQLKTELLFAKVDDLANPPDPGENQEWQDPSSRASRVFQRDRHFRLL
jgi:hypothetical protein